MTLAALRTTESDLESTSTQASQRNSPRRQNNEISQTQESETQVETLGKDRSIRPRTLSDPFNLTSLNLEHNIPQAYKKIQFMN